MPRRNQVTSIADYSMRSPAALSAGPAAGQSRTSSEDGIGTRLGASFPASPMIGTTPTYGEDVVDLLRYLLVTNTIGPDVGEGADEEGPRAQAQGYWGFGTPEETDLNYSITAPDLDGVEGGEDVDGNTIASHLGPNLLPPPIISPTTDVEDVVLPDLISTPPFVGNGKANPRATSISNRADLVGSQLLGNTPLEKGSTSPLPAEGNVGVDGD